MNWLDEETSVLLDALAEYKLSRGMNNINIKDFRWVHRIFMSKLKDSTRTAENCKNRVKHLKGQYTIAKKYTKYTGGDGWDYKTHKLKVSPQRLKEIILENEKNNKFLRRPFPWFERLDNLCGGMRADGDEETPFGETEHAEHTGSSDTQQEEAGGVHGRIHADVDYGPYDMPPPGYEFGQGAGVNRTHQFSGGSSQQASETRTYRQGGTSSASEIDKQ
ncbi:hypothetical protein LUZ62_058533 [Rhynchospora pubera]|uniref:Myb/SANT-like DNA-binding domain-containing protein n=1 Tax=Rhynchospora pubera TaxID=906938 RepID=A0AAV8E462_9POAL|nr:hypothetical protein LUZ62_058533 [Rhynchospora pubera]